ncbi:MAG: phosphoribosylamine--glycine ligase [Ignavibacteria bacterium RBG_16_34_14]|nr:MAG: phosphoribosylamine--glycine ligase [Ignavibacteria bacterium RBG_16_34_14]
MRVLLIGSGGREHALALKLSKSSLLDKLFIMPGNPGTKQIGENIRINPSHGDKVLQFCKDEKIDLVVIGPEQPLVDGLSDYLRNSALKVFGPSQKAAQIEAHKSFAKQLMKKYNIPTSDFVEFNSNEYGNAISYLKKSKYPIVIKADGLAAGKGVLICNNYDVAERSLKEIFLDKVFGSAGEKVVIEEFMEGEEASILAITDGTDFICLPSSQDHKRIGDNDTGKNTGGMGAYSPAPIVTKELLSQIEDKIIKPTLTGMRDVGSPFSGCLYAGLMITNVGPRVVEFNCRFGDPETQVVLPLLKGDFLKLLYSSAIGKLDKNAVHYSEGSAVCIVAASKGYPDSYQKGFEITGLDINDKKIIIYHAGTDEINEKIITNGGRVLGVTSVFNKNDLRETREKAYEAIRQIHFEGMYYRKDIAIKALNRY